MKEEWLFPEAVVPVDAETTAALVVEIHRLIDVVGGMALAQPKQEPCKGKNCGSTNPKLHSAECFDEHEFTILNGNPFGYFEFVLDDGDGYWREIEDGGIDGKPLYTSPPQRQPLTDEEIQKLAASLMYTKLDYSLAFARAVEAKHGIGDKT